MNKNRFEEIQFFLAGYDPSLHHQVKSNLISLGAHEANHYSPNCTHVVVHDLVSDDPICVAARRDGKILVTSLWAEHSIDIGVPQDISNIIYRPPKDLNGIPGAEKLFICLTGYDRQTREDIMIMVSIMGAQFFKPLLAHKVTHLICYNFEGEKYQLAKKMKRIKLVNHRWLEDSLRAWELLPEEQYSRSSYELEMMEAEVKDSDEETEDIPTNVAERVNVTGIPISQIDKLPSKPDQVTESRKFVKTEKPSPVSGNAKGTIGSSGLPLSAEGHLGNLSGPNSNKTAGLHADYSNPSSLRMTRASGASLYNEKCGNSARRPEEQLRSDDLHTFIGTPSSRGLSDVDAVKYSPSSLRKSPRKSGISLQSSKRLDIAEERPLENLAGKVSDAVRSSSIEPEKKRSSSAFIQVSSAEAASTVERPCGLQMTGGHMNNLHATLESQKLTSSSSKRIDAAEPATPLSATGICRNSSLNLGSHVGSETPTATGDKSSIDNSSVKAMGKKTAASKYLALDKWQGSGSDKMGAETELSIGHIAGCTTLDVSNKNAQPQNLQGNSSLSPVTKDLDDTKSGNPDLNTDDKITNPISKPPKKKMEARRTLGSRPRATKKVCNAEKGSPSGNLSGVDADLHSVGRTSTADESLVPPALYAPTVVGAKPLQKFDVEANDDTEPSYDETEAPHYLNIQHGKSTDKSDPNETRANETPNLELPAIKSKGALLTKETLSVKAKRKIVPKGATENADAAAGGRESEQKETMKGETVAAAGKKRHGTRLVKQSVEVQEENELLVSNDKDLSDGKICATTLKRRRGNLLLSKPDINVEVEEDNEPALVRDEGQNHGDKYLEKLPSKSKSTEYPTEVENEDGAARSNGQSPSKVLKSVGKKKRGTSQLNKSQGPVSHGKETSPVHGNRGELAGVSNVTQGPIEKEKVSDNIRSDRDTTKAKKLAGKKRRGTLVLSNPERSVEVGKENELVLGDAGKIDCVAHNDQDKTKGIKLAGKKRRGTLILNKSERSVEMEKENESVLGDDKDKNKCATLKSNQTARKSEVVGSMSSNAQIDLAAVKNEPGWFIVSGHRLQRKEFLQMIKRLKGKHCRDSHQWSYQATHLVVPDPIRRTEKFFAAAASGSWIRKTDYLTASSQAGKFLPEEPYEWHTNELTEDGAINLEAPRKWRLLKEKTGHGAFYGMRIVIYGECIAPPLDTLKRVVKSGDGTILATSPPYTRFLSSGVDFAIVSPGMPRVDIWVQEFLRHEIPCVLADYLVEYVCKPGYPLDRHVQYNTHEWAAKSFTRLMSLSKEIVAEAATPEDCISEDLACQVCGSSDRAEVMLVCGDENGSTGCGVGTHIDCCDPPLKDVPEEDWFCPKCSESKIKLPVSTKKKPSSKRR